MLCYNRGEPCDYFSLASWNMMMLCQYRIWEGHWRRKVCSSPGFGPWSFSRSWGLGHMVASSAQWPATSPKQPVSSFAAECHQGVTSLCMTFLSSEAQHLLMDSFLQHFRRWNSSKFHWHGTTVIDFSDIQETTGTSSPSRRPGTQAWEMRGYISYLGALS